MVTKRRFKWFENLPFKPENWNDNEMFLIRYEGMQFLKNLYGKLESMALFQKDGELFFGSSINDGYEDVYELRIAFNFRPWEVTKSKLYEGYLGNNKYFNLKVRHKKIEKWYKPNFWGKPKLDSSMDHEISFDWLYYSPFKSDTTNSYPLEQYRRWWAAGLSNYGQLDPYTINIVDNYEETGYRGNGGSFTMIEHALDISMESIKIIDFINEEVHQFLKEIKNNCNQKLTKLSNKKNEFFLKIDHDNDGNIDLLDSNVFDELMQKYQTKIVSIDKNYIHSFVQISTHLKTYLSKIQTLYTCVIDSNNYDKSLACFSLLKESYKSYELLLFHAINMLTSLIKDDYISFYEIYESFENLGVFNSTWQNELIKKLEDIEQSLDEVSYAINKLEKQVEKQFSKLEYVIRSSFNELQESVSFELKNINSSMDYQNLLSTINTYQLYKINTNTKKLRGGN